MAAKQRNSARRATHSSWDERITLVFSALVTGIAIIGLAVVPFNLPSNPDHWWITDMAQGLLETAGVVTLFFLFLVAVCLAVPAMRQTTRFRAGRLVCLSIAILLLSCSAASIYGLALLHNPGRWNRLILLPSFLGMLLGVCLLELSYLVWHIDHKRILSA